MAQSEEKWRGTDKAWAVSKGGRERKHIVESQNEWGKMHVEKSITSNHIKKRQKCRKEVESWPKERCKKRQISTHKKLIIVGTKKKKEKSAAGGATQE